MNLSNQPVVSPEQSFVASNAPIASPEVPVASPEAPVAAPSNRPVVTTLGADVVSSAQSLLGTVVIAIFVITFIVQAFQIPSESMENTLLVGDYLLVNKLVYGGHGLGDRLMPYEKIKRGDIVVFHYPVDPQQHFVKRVIGVPGDHLRMVNKKVWINGKPLDESYVRFLEPPNNIFPKGHFFLLGDNRDDSQDSHYWGFVPRENIIGKPLVIYWSVRDWDKNPSSSVQGRLYHLAYAITHIFQITRWNRTLRLVH